jgi:hypothetical protein
LGERNGMISKAKMAQLISQVTRGVWKVRICQRGGSGIRRHWRRRSRIECSEYLLGIDKPLVRICSLRAARTTPASTLRYVGTSTSIIPILDTVLSSSSTGPASWAYPFRPSAFILLVEPSESTAYLSWVGSLALHH